MGGLVLNLTDNCDDTFDLCFLPHRRDEVEAFDVSLFAVMAHIQRTSRLDLGNYYGMLHDDVAHHCDDTLRPSEAKGKIEEEIKKYSASDKMPSQTEDKLVLYTLEG